MKDSLLLTIHTDGASRGNPGDAAFSYVIEGAGAEPIEEAGCLGKMTNNQAEYIALIRAMRRAKELGTHHRVLVYSDSELMVKQLEGTYRVKNKDLLDLYEEARALCREFSGGVNVVHVRRSENKRADALCNEVLDAKRDGIAAPDAARCTSPARSTAASAGPSVSDEALACLRDAESAWRRGEEVPAPETVWRWLVEILARHGVTALDSAPGRKGH